VLDCLVIVIPGIAGSVLADDHGVVWGKSLRGVLGAVADPDRLSVNTSPSMRAVGVMPTLGFFPPFQLPGYDKLVRQLVKGLDGSPTVDCAAESQERNLAADIVVFPYDFRLGVAAASHRLATEVNARLAHLPPRDRVGRVVVIGHSMGGLVGRHWLAQPDQASLCRALLTLGTPHRGASKALEWLVNGVSLGGTVPVVGSAMAGSSRLLLGDLTEVLRGWPATYDLLPTYEVVEDPQRGTTLTPLDLAHSSGPGYAASETFLREAGRAKQLHDDITSVWANVEHPRPQVIPFYACDHGTPHVATLAEGELNVKRSDPSWQPNCGWQGDGTVPAISAIPPELAAREAAPLRHPVFDRHVPMASTPQVVAMVRNLLGQDLSAIRGPESDSALRLGVDLDEACLLGQELGMTARLLAGEEVAPETVTVWVTANLNDGSESVRIRAEHDPTLGWAGTLRLPLAGLWQVSVQAVNSSSAEPPVVTDWVAVIDPDEVQ
jgi:pimeloyl-ACP methyl ester carboxylesterase